MLYNQYGYPLRRNPAFIPSAGGSGLQADVPSTCFVLEASNIDSTDGSSQTWSNVITSPADGSAQTDFDMYRGVDGTSTSTDPTFNGTAGTPGAYFSNDGGDYFLSTQASNVSPGFMKGIQRTDDSNGFWLAFAFQWRGTKRFFQNATSTSEYGFSLTSGGLGNLIFSRYRNSTVQSTTLFANNQMLSGNNYCIIVSMNAARNNFRVWKNTRTASNVTPSAAWSAVTSDATNRFAIGTNYPVVNTYDVNLTRYYCDAGGNDYLDDTAAGLIFDYFNNSTGITFA